MHERSLLETIEMLIDEKAKLFTSVRGLAADADLYGVGLTPFTAIQLTLALEKEFNVKFPKRMLNRRSMSSIDAICSCVRQLQQEQSTLKAAYRPRRVEKFMLVRDMIHSCSNKDVARAVVACIGGRFAERVGKAAHEQCAPVGCFVADIVRNFAASADDEARAALQREMAGSDQPILNGLRHVVGQALQGGAPEATQPWFPKDTIVSDRKKIRRVRPFLRRSDLGRRTRRRELKADKLFMLQRRCRREASRKRMLLGVGSTTAANCDVNRKSAWTRAIESTWRSCFQEVGLAELCSESFVSPGHTMREKYVDTPCWFSRA